MKYIVLFFIFIQINILYAQDEKVLRNILLGQDFKNDSFELFENYKYLVRSPKYKIDLNGDGIFENIIVVKADYENWIEIEDANSRKMFQFKFLTLGLNPYLYKITFSVISKNIKVLILHFYEGYAEHIKFKGSSSLYYLTMENGDMNKIKVSKGPYIMLEMKNSYGSYNFRNYEVKTEDLNSDGIKEIVIKSANKVRASFYKGDGIWQNI